MPTPSRLIPCTALILLALPPSAPLAAADRGTPPRSAAPLGLSRLQPTVASGQPAALAPARFVLDDLAPGAAPGVTRLRRDTADLLALAAGAEWSRPLRSSGRDATYVSLQVYASASTIVDVGGVRLGFTLSPAGHSLQLMYDDASAGALQWKPLHQHFALGTYGGRSLAAVPTLTVRLDPATQTWDLYSGTRLVTGALPQIAGRPGGGPLKIRAGAEGAWVSGLALADEHPLFEDTNANGIDDAAERRLRGGLLPTLLGPVDRQAILREWREDQRSMPPPALYVDRPAPDRPPAATAAARS